MKQSLLNTLYRSPMYYGNIGLFEKIFQGFPPFSAVAWRMFLFLHGESVADHGEPDNSTGLLFRLDNSTGPRVLSQGFPGASLAY